MRKETRFVSWPAPLHSVTWRLKVMCVTLKRICCGGLCLWLCVGFIPYKFKGSPCRQAPSPGTVACLYKYTHLTGETICTLYKYICVYIYISFVSECVCVVEGLNAPAPARTHPWDGFRISGTLRWINGKGLASRRAARAPTVVVVGGPRRLDAGAQSLF